MADWPQHADGSPKKPGELTSEEKREQLRAAWRRVLLALSEVKAALLDEPEDSPRVAAALRELARARGEQV